MSKDYLTGLTTIHISRSARSFLEKLRGHHQSMGGAVDDFIETHTNLLEEIEQMKQSTISLPEDLLKRLKNRQRPHQAMAGVLEEMLEAVERVEKAEGHFIPLPDIKQPSDKG